MAAANVLLLDEPTNHLDIASKEVFEDALLEYPGTVIVVSHDRYFLSKIPTRILELEKDGLTEYLGAYDYYIEKKASVESGRKYLKEMAENVGSEASEKTGSGSAGSGGQLEKTLTAAEERALKKSLRRRRGEPPERKKSWKDSSRSMKLPSLKTKRKCAKQRTCPIINIWRSLTKKTRRCG